MILYNHVTVETTRERRKLSRYTDIGFGYVYIKPIYLWAVPPWRGASHGISQHMYRFSELYECQDSKNGHLKLWMLTVPMLFDILSLTIIVVLAAKLEDGVGMITLDYQCGKVHIGYRNRFLIG